MAEVLRVRKIRSRAIRQAFKERRQSQGCKVTQDSHTVRSECPVLTSSPVRQPSTGQTVSPAGLLDTPHPVPTTHIHLTFTSHLVSSSYSFFLPSVPLWN